MITPTLVQQPFANTGDKTAIPQTDAQGFVNYTDGYTAYYEISLTANNPQAKAVERRAMNQMFNDITTNIQAWQGQTIAPWYSNYPNGYSKNALVLRLVSGVATPYRSKIDSNTVDPIGNPTAWEYQSYVSEIINVMPMPAGGGDASAEVVAAAVNANTLTDGTWEFGTDAIAQASTNLPIPPGGSVSKGLLESVTWNSKTAGVRRYTDSNGNLFLSSMNGSGVWNAWVYIPQISYIQGRTYDYGTLAGSANTYTLTAVPAFASLVNGMEVRAKVNVANTGASTLNVSGLGAKAIVSRLNAALTAGELAANNPATFRYDSAVGSGSWVLIDTGGALTGAAATDGTGLPNLTQVNSLISSALTAYVTWANVANKPNYYGTLTGTVGSSSAAYTLTVSSGPALSDGLEINLKTAANMLNPAGTATVAYNGGAAVTLFSMVQSSTMYGGEVPNAAYMTLRYDASAPGWVIISSSGTKSTLQANGDYQVPNLAQVKSLISAAALTSVDWSNITNKPNVAIQNQNNTFTAVELSTSQPYIDFHYGNDTNDYNMRFINDSNLNLTIQSYQANTIVTFASGIITNYQPTYLLSNMYMTPGNSVTWGSGTTASNRGQNRWGLGANSDSSLMTFTAWDDAGTTGVSIVTFNRKTYIANFWVRPTFNGYLAWDAGNFNPSLYIAMGQTNTSSLTTGTGFASTSPGTISGLTDSSSAGTNPRSIQVIASNNANNSAVAGFGMVREGSYGIILGLDTDNVVKIGGWSMGNVAYPVLHTNNLKTYLPSTFAGLAYNEVGQYGLFIANGGATGTALTPGTLKAGSNLIYCATGWAPSSSQVTAPGTWRLHGYLYDADGSDTNSISLWQRVA